MVTFASVEFPRVVFEDVEDLRSIFIGRRETIPEALVGTPSRGRRGSELELVLME